MTTPLQITHDAGEPVTGVGVHLQESRYNVWVEWEGCRYVYNGVSGALLAVRPEEGDALQTYLTREGLAEGTPALIAEMIRRRMLIPTTLDELAFLERRYRATRWGTSTFALTLVTSLGCNFDCPYCYQTKHPSLMSDAVQQAVLQVVTDRLPRIRRLSVTWSGGEPLVGKRTLLLLSDRLIGVCDRAGVEYVADLTTNGYLLDEPTCVELRAHRVGHVQVNLDGPPAVHDRRRPLLNGKGTFHTILANLRQAVNHLPITVRVNLDEDNLPHVEELLGILQAEGLAGRLRVYPAQVMAAPSANYRGSCLSNAAFAQVERAFLTLATRYGFAQASLPCPTGAPCTAVRANELVVGSQGELYKCWGSVGHHAEVIGSLLVEGERNGLLQQWLTYDPFSDEECRSCIALPVCMGGCARYALDPLQRENRCGTFRHFHREQVLAFVKQNAGKGQVDLPPACSLAYQKETR